MSKRKLAVDLDRGVIASGQRSSITRLQDRATSVIRRKYGAMNVRPKSNYKIAQDYTNAERNGTDLCRAREFSAVPNEGVKLPKSRFDSPSSCKPYTPRPDHFLAESVRKSDVIRPNSSSSSYKVVDENIPESRADLPTGSDRIVPVAVLPSHGHGDSPEMYSVDELVQQPQRRQHAQQGSRQPVTVSQHHVPIEQHVDRTNQSEALLNKQIPLLGYQSHRPLVPHPTHGSTPRDSLIGKAEVTLPHAPIEKCSTLSIQHQGQNQQRTSTTAGQAHRFRSFVSQQVLRIPQQLMVHRTNDDVRTALQDDNLLKVDDSSTNPAYEKYPAVKTCNTICQPQLTSHGKSNNQQPIINVGQPMTLRDITCNDTSVQQREAMVLQRQNQHSYQTQQRQQYFNWQGRSSINAVQDTQQMYQQMRDNMIRQRQMQQRVLSQQQQMMIRAQPQIGSRPPVRHARIPTHETIANSKSLENRCTHEERHANTLSDFYQGSHMIPSQRVHQSQTAIPHHEMLMRQRNIGYQTSNISPQNASVNNHQVIGVSPNVNDPSRSRTADTLTMGDNALQYGDSKLDYTHCQPKAEQLIAEQQTETYGRETMPCPWDGTAIDKHPPSRHMHQTRNPVPPEQYLTTKQERPASACHSKAAAVHGRQQSQCQQSQPHREYQPVSKDQQLQMMQHFDQLRTRYGPRSAKKEYIEFTSAMIRDQELLVSNMRQQKIPEDTMKRQFDALLDEQRRHLAFINQVESTEIQNNAKLHRNSKILIDDQRPDWMGRITPARVRVQQVQRSMSSPSQWVAVADREERRRGLERTKQHVERQQQTSQQPSNSSQYTTTIGHRQSNPGNMNIHRSDQRQAANWECNAGSPPSPVYTSGVLRQFMPSPQATLSWSQQRYTPPYDPLYISNHQRYDTLAQLHQGLQHQNRQQEQSLHQQQEQHHQKCLEIRNGQHSNQQYQQQRSVNCRQPQWTELERNARSCDKMIPGQADESPCYNSNTYQQQQEPDLKRDKPSSLLKLQKYKKYIRPQRQNNGLQDVEIGQSTLETLEVSDVRKGVDYVMDLGDKVTAVKFNGIQDPNELGKLPPPPVEYLEKIRRSERPQISANGLCNTRNADNPALPPKSFADKTDRMNRSPSDGYPRQCHLRDKLAARVEHGSQIIIAEKENGSIAGTVRQQIRDSLFRDCDQPICEGRLSHELNAVRDPVQLMKIPCNGGNLIESHGNVPITPYKFNGSQSQYHGQMDQFHRNQQNLKIFARNDTTETLTKQPAVLNGSSSTARSPWTGTDCEVQPELRGVQSKTVADSDRNQRELALTGQMVTGFDESPMLTHDAHNVTSIVANVACNNVQPEIRQSKIIGGFTYLARKVDHVQNQSVIAPNTFVTSKYLQPLGSFK